MKQATRDLVAAESALAEAAADAVRATEDVPRVDLGVWTRPTLQAELARLSGETMSLSKIGRTLRVGRATASSDANLAP